jgi:hypothetical protein
VIGELYEHALAGWAKPVIEHADGSRVPLPVEAWLHASAGDRSLLDRCEGPTLDIGSGPGRLTVALAERGVPALGIDITPYAVGLARSSGAMVLLRDVFDRVPGTGRWATCSPTGTSASAATRPSCCAGSASCSRRTAGRWWSWTPRAGRCAASRCG